MSTTIDNMLARSAARRKSPERISSLFVLSVTNEICAEMKRQKLTRKALAEKLGVSVSYVSQLLNSTSKFSLERVGKILAVLDVDFIFRCIPKGADYTFEVTSPDICGEVVEATVDLGQASVLDWKILEMASFPTLAPPESTYSGHLCVTLEDAQGETAQQPSKKTVIASLANAA